VTEEILENAFIPFGGLKQILLPKKENESKHSGYAFIEFEDADDAKAAIDNMNDSELFGRVLTCNLANPRSSKLDSAIAHEQWLKEAKSSEDINAEMKKAQHIEQ
jgi:peptidyl-prolyl isomerase E (cyclophilin E)